MAAVEPRQFGRLEPARVGAYPPPPSHIPRRVDSPARGCGFPPLVSPPRSTSDDASSSDDEEQEDWRELYGSQLQLEVEPAAQDPRDEGTADAWVERNPCLVRLTGKHPLNCEPPLARLMQHGFITPAPLHYVRNHGAVPRGDWATWAVEVTGLVRRPARLTMDELARDFPAVEIPVTLACAGNRRKEQNMVRQTAGFGWGAAGVSTSVWRGARLRDVLRRCGVAPRNGLTAARSTSASRAPRTSPAAAAAGPSTAPASRASGPWTRRATSCSRTCRTASRCCPTTASPCASSSRAASAAAWSSG
jgi:nitrate reductase (NAD(P)H)